MKAIIIAAGMGQRLKTMHPELPKCLMEVCGKTMLQHQLEAYQANGIEDISLIKGFAAEKIDLPNIQYHHNTNYKNNNILNSLMYAQSDFDQGFIASYSDIIFTKDVVSQVIRNKEDISIVVDRSWLDQYIGRDDHPMEEAEKVISDENDYVMEIGKMTEQDNDYCGEFIGMLQCNANGAKIFKEYFYKAEEEFQGKPFIRAKSFEKAYITDFLQYLTNHGIKVHCEFIDGGWYEIDTPQDFERVSSQLRKEQS